MSSGSVGQNVRVRKLLIGLVATVIAVVVAAVGVDFGTAIYAEYRIARSVRTAAHLNFDPWASIVGFPFVTQAMRRHYNELELRAQGVEQPVAGKVSLEATMHSVDPDRSWLIEPDTALTIGKLESRNIIDSTHLGRFMGINDLLVEAPARETNDATGGTTASGISDNHGLVFTGTPRKVPGFDKKVSISVDLSTAGPDQTTLVFTATGVLTGPGTAAQPVPEDKVPAVLAAFSATMPGQKLPFGIAPINKGVRGSDVIIEGIAEGVTVTLNGFRQT